MYDTLLPAFTKFSERSFTEWADFANTDTARELGKANAEFKRSLLQASLLAGDDRLVLSVLEARTLDLAFKD